MFPSEISDDLVHLECSDEVPQSKQLMHSFQMPTSPLLDGRELGPPYLRITIAIALLGTK